MTYGFRAVTNPLAGPLAGPRADGGGEGAGPERGGRADGGGSRTADVVAFHQRLPGYAATPLLSLPGVAAPLGVGEVLVKCETVRFGLPAFKMLGASWATYRALCARLGGEAQLGEWHDMEELSQLVKPLLPFRLAAATDGNHGRAVARMARWLGFEARIFVPAGTTQARIDAIGGEGAEVVVVRGGYDDAVARSAEEDGRRALVISDTSWPGYADVPRWVIEGYATLFVEIEDALGRSPHRRPDVVVVPVGVGALAAATVRHFGNGAVVIGVEPTDAACVTASALAGRPTTLPGEQRSIMAGLNCGTPSPVAWPIVSRGLAGFVSVDDDWARDGVRTLAGCGVEAGETGAAALGGLTALLRQGRASPLGALVHEGASVLALVTEGASDPPAWREILGADLVGS